ncbi:hypothetical protein FDK12_14460 [Arthrobacter sp. NamB2]|uniref:hypothetical protein n=1 Tax=Arthrobacter sp. NamB2 TaxID=2576035 RepID=UPI0010C95DF6|nr:hypothetical protein [Arthrobacter sp. NamB2]TKV26154.1 hypothetical protein FDK12_14460 [Arthrobacter sp. NamB2]
MDILSVLSRGHATVVSHHDSNELRQDALAFIEAYKCRNGTSVFPASSHAERVLGAAMMLCPSVRGGCEGETVILDVSYASGTLIARAVDSIRASGNSSPLHAIVLQSLVPDEDISKPYDVLTFVVASDKTALRSSWQHGESRESRVLLPS